MTAETTSLDQRALEFEAHRPLLFSIAYRMLGSVTEAEDAVQETFVRYSSVPADQVRAVRPFLTTVVTRICLDILKSARATRETYVGPWLPEPLVGESGPAGPSPIETAERHESISIAFLVLLETLSPVERAVFLLREVFDYGYDEIGRIVERGEPACRQIFRRAKQHIVARRPRFDCTDAEQERLVRSFIQASEEGDLGALNDVLAEDVTLWTDGGGRRAAALKPIHGPDRVARLVVSAVRKGAPLAEQQVQVAAVNGRPGAIIFVHGVLAAVVGFGADAGRIREIHVMLNPDKLARLAQTYNHDLSQPGPGDHTLPAS